MCCRIIVTWQKFCCELLKALYNWKALPLFQDDLLSSSEAAVPNQNKDKRKGNPKKTHHGNDHHIGAPSGSAWLPCWSSWSGNINREETVQRLPGMDIKSGFKENWIGAPKEIESCFGFGYLGDLGHILGASIPARFRFWAVSPSNAWPKWDILRKCCVASSRGCHNHIAP